MFHSVSSLISFDSNITSNFLPILAYKSEQVHTGQCEIAFPWQQDELYKLLTCSIFETD